VVVRVIVRIIFSPEY